MAVQLAEEDPALLHFPSRREPGGVPEHAAPSAPSDVPVATDVDLDVVELGLVALPPGRALCSRAG